ncbi:MAG: phage terminase large subunit [Bacteroidetes bacterium]|nr:phage terminase large subunit [Bacteroidota bacterium]
MKNNNKTIAQLTEILPDHQWKTNKHIAFLDNIISENISKGDAKIIINMPPRHGKTTFCAEWLPLWYLYNFPTKNIMLATYNQKYANHLGRNVKDLVNRYKNILQLEIRKDVRAADNFVLESGGGMLSIGANGTITGRGADLLLIDDPIKNDAQANSITYRDNIWDWFNATAFTRIEPDGSVIIIMTRWHQDDLTGRIMVSNTFNEWIHIKLPAIAEINDSLGRHSGEPLWNEKFNVKKLEQIKRQIGEFWFASLYQQNPLNPIGNIFKRNTFRYFFVEEDNYILKNTIFYSAKNGRNNDLYKEYIINRNECPVFAVCDLATTLKQTADYTVIIVFAISPRRHILILDIIRKKFEATEHLAILKDICKKYNPVLIGIESVQYQIALVQSARKDGLPIKELKPDKDKVSRSLPMTALLEDEKVFFLNDANWLADFEEEVLNFPNGRYDDQVDAFAYITYMLNPILTNNTKIQISKRYNKKNKLCEY